MRSRLLTGTQDLAKVFRQWSGKAQDIRIVTAWATTDCVVFDCLKVARSKISTMVVGLDFYTTSPSFLKSFQSFVLIGKALHGGTFHPKVYLFEDRGQCCCVMGSSNFTSGGFANNTEVNICIEGRKSESFFWQVRTFIEEQAEHSYSISAVEVDDYREQFEGLKASRARLAKFRFSKTARAKSNARKKMEKAGEEPPEQLNKTWPEFVQLILARKRRGHIVKGTTNEPGYLQTAERCQTFFTQYGHLAKMPVAGRKFVGGTTRDGGIFGSMRGNGYFKQRLNDDPASLDAALNKIPFRGNVDKRRFDAFAARYQWERAGVGTASRLLAMKRPDLFICTDSKNRSGIADAFGVPASSLLTFGGYWDLMQQIWRCPWWRAPRPRPALERRVWNARVALLDSLYYVDRE